MARKQYEIKVYWSANDIETITARDPEHVKEVIDKTVFCLRHGCPLPEHVVIRRTA